MISFEFLDRLVTAVNSFALLRMYSQNNEKNKNGKANAFGLGMDDESLFLSACYLAQKNYGVTNLQIEMIGHIISSFPIGIQKRIILAIGQSEEEYEDSDLSNGASRRGRKSKGNIRGAQAIAFITAAPDESGMRQRIEMSGLLTSTMDVVSERIEKLNDALQSAPRTVRQIREKIPTAPVYQSPERQLLTALWRRIRRIIS